MSETFSNNLLNGTIYHLLNFEKYSNFQQAAKQAAIGWTSIRNAEAYAWTFAVWRLTGARWTSPAYATT